jgi:hypothetical protein
MTPETLEMLNNFYEQYPNGIDIGNINPGIGAGGGGNPGGTGTGTDDGSYTVVPVDPVGDLGIGAPVDNTTPYVPPETRSASSYALTGVQPTMPVFANPFKRPESQQGIGSLAGGG